VYQFVLSAFGDEIDSDLAKQLQLLQSLSVKYLEFRSAWGINVATLTDAQVSDVRALCANYDVRISALGSPVGKTPIVDPIETELERAKRLFEIGAALGTSNMRIFAFYPPNDVPESTFDEYVPQAIDRLSQLTELAAAAGFTLLLENDERLTADTPERCYKVLSAIDSPHLRLAWDGANFINSQVQNPTTSGWEMLKPYIGTVHIKDMSAKGHVKRAAGEGDAQMPELLTELVKMDYHGFLAVEPHPYVVEGRGEIRGADGMTYAVAAIRKLLNAANLTEHPTLN
jgi:L-ribulose-5-phosphate 3-epimerase